MPLFSIFPLPGGGVRGGLLVAVGDLFEIIFNPPLNQFVHKTPHGPAKTGLFVIAPVLLLDKQGVKDFEFLKGVYCLFVHGTLGTSERALYTWLNRGARYNTFFCVPSA